MRRSSDLGLILSILKPFRWELALSFLLALLAIVIGLLAPWPLKLIIDTALARKPAPALLHWIAVPQQTGEALALISWIALGSVLLFLVSQGLGTFQAYFNVGLKRQIDYSVASKLFDHLQRLSLQAHGRYQAADLVKRILQDSTCISALVFSVLRSNVVAAITLMLMAAILVRIDALLTVLILLMTPAYVWLLHHFSRPMQVFSRRYEDLEAQRLVHAEQSLQNLVPIQVFNRSGIELAMAQEISSRTLNAFRRLTFSQSLFSGLLGLVSATATSMILLVGGFQASKGNLSIGDLTLFLSYIVSLLSPLETLSGSSASVAAARSKLDRAFELLRLDELIPETGNPHQLSRPFVAGRITLNSVCFAAKHGPLILSDICLDIKPGETIAIVGQSGAGKSTLVSLLLRFYDVTSGSIQIDGVDLRDYRLSDLRRQFALLSQDPLLVPASIEANIAYGIERADPEAIRHAAEMAHAAPFIERLPDGYQTLLGERGEPLSGGEIQRLALARTLLRNAPILILDEPSSALDVFTEARIMKLLEPVVKHRTTILISHSLSTIRHADRIVVLEGGRICELGTHDQLISAQGVYATLVRSELRA